MRTALFAVAVLILVAACGDSEPKATGEIRGATHTADDTPTPNTASGDNTSTMQPIFPPQLDSPSSRVGGVATANREVQLLEYQIRMEQTIPAGQHTFSIENAGKEDHAFEIEGDGVHLKTPPIKRGERALLSANLKPGTYTIYCPVEGHKGHGMTTTLTVQ